MYMGRICWCGRVLLQNLHAPFDGDRRPSKRCLQPCTVVLLALQSDPFEDYRRDGQLRSNDLVQESPYRSTLSSWHDVDSCAS